MSINDDRVGLKCSSVDKDEWKRAAERSGRSLSNWIVWTLNQAAAEENAEAESEDSE